MDKMKQETADLTQENIARIGELFPNVITEMKDENGKLKKGINFELLKQELSGDVIDGEECYDFTWVGKKASIVEANTPIRKTLRPCIEESKNWETTENLYIEGDNLDVLKLLQESYLNSIKMIYIDPPYNTGNDFIYRDKFMMDEEEYEKKIDLHDEEGNLLFKNTETRGRFHSSWCSMMYSRLKLARSLLTEDGVIFISIDDNEVHNLKKVCDEVFGEQNFVDFFLWTKTSTPPSLSKKVRKTVEFLLCYEKEKNNQSFFGSSLDNGDAPLLNTGNPYRTLVFPPNSIQFTFFDSGTIEARNYSKVELLNDVVVKSFRNTNEVSFSGEFKWSQEKLDEEIALGTYFIVKSDKLSLRFQRKEDKKNFKAPNNLFSDIELNKSSNVATNESAVKELIELNLDGFFDYPKPTSLLRKLTKMVTHDSPGSIIIDFFSGSATTAHAAMQLNAEDGGNRKFIMVQLPEPCDEKSEAFKAGYKNICEIGKERIRRAGDKINKEIEEGNKQLKLGEEPKKPVDIGFRVLKVDTTNMKDIYYAASEYTQNLLTDQISNIKEDRTDLDLLYGVLLEWGLPLSLKHEIEEIDGVKIHIVDNDSLIACFSESVPEKVVREIAKRQPLRAVFRDSSFASSSDKINVEEIFKLLAPNTSVKVI